MEAAFGVDVSVCLELIGVWYLRNFSGWVPQIGVKHIYEIEWVYLLLIFRFFLLLTIVLVKQQHFLVYLVLFRRFEQGISVDLEP